MPTQSTFFYVFNQNNSGGYFVIDENVAATVVIEAKNAKQAGERLEEIINADGKYTSFCGCCGRRWSPDYADGVYSRYWVEADQLERFEKERKGGEAILYPLEGERRPIPWARYGMYAYLPEVQEEQGAE